MALNYDLNNTGPEVQERLDQVMPNRDDILALQQEIDEKAPQETTYTKTEVDELLSGKVDKEAGKGLSTNDYTNEEKQSVADLRAAVGDGGSIDARIQAAVAAEAQARETSEENLSESLAGLIEAETTRATASEQNILEQIDMMLEDSWDDHEYPDTPTE